jgi:hypothetical protein
MQIAEKKVCALVVIAGCYTPPVPGLAKHVLDLVTLYVEDDVIVDFPVAGLY